MTFQIGFAASDGVLLASDQKHTNLYGFPASTLAPKIKISDSGYFAYCSAGDTDFSNLLAESVEGRITRNRSEFTSMSDGKTRAELLQCVKTARRKDKAYRKQRGVTQPSVGGSVLFVFRRDGIPSLWMVSATAPVAEASLIVPGEIIKAGFANSPAVFFLSRYAEKIEGTMQSFIPLAIHTVLMAECDTVKGVEIGLFGSDVFRKMTDEELQPYIERSKRIDSVILDNLI
jgi:hypothetical protein